MFNCRLLRLNAFRLVLIAAVCLAVPQTAAAGLIDRAELITLIQSTVSDLDASMIGLHQAHASEQPATGALSQTLTIDDAGWNAQLTGSYGGLPVTIDYVGTIVFTGGPTNRYDFAYTSDWLIDGQSGTGAGSGVYTDPEFSFEIDLIEMSVSGSISVQYGLVSLTLTGSKDLDDQELTVSGEVAAGDLPLIDASLASGEISFTLNQRTGEYESELSASALNLIPLGSATINEGSLGSGQSTVDSEASRLPEPSTIVLVGAGLLFCLRLRTRLS